MLKVKNLGNKIFLPSGKWFMKDACEELELFEVSLLKLIKHPIERIEETKKKKK